MDKRTRKDVAIDVGTVSQNHNEGPGQSAVDYNRRKSLGQVTRYWNNHKCLEFPIKCHWELVADS